jgi:hypothetical protein
MCILYICIYKYNIVTSDTIFLCIMLTINEKQFASPVLCLVLCVCGRSFVVLCATSYCEGVSDLEMTYNNRLSSFIFFFVSGILVVNIRTKNSSYERAYILKSTIFWDITPCSPLKVNRHFFLLPTFMLISSSAYFFNPEDGGDMFFRNVGWHSTDYTALYPRSWYSS